MPHRLETQTTPVYLSRKPWNAARPHILVIACSDGRIQENVDDFLHNHLGIDSYDRMYMPGGPGALSQSGHELLRADLWRRESDFLVTAHAVEQVILLFHAAAPDGPIEANCADYKRKLPAMSAGECREIQVDDTLDVLNRVFDVYPNVRIYAYRAEVKRDGQVQFINLLKTQYQTLNQTEPQA